MAPLLRARCQMRFFWFWCSGELVEVLVEGTDRQAAVGVGRIKTSAELRVCVPPLLHVCRTAEVRNPDACEFHSIPIASNGRPGS